MKVLVTGGTGFIGSHTVVELQRAGYDIVIVDNLENSTADVVDRITEITGIRPFFEQADIRDREALLRVFSKHHDIYAVVHFAAYKAVGESVAKPLLYYQNNVGGTLNLLSVMEQKNVDCLVFSSSCTVYGQDAVLPVTEESPLGPAFSPYGHTKIVCEEMLKDQCAATSLRTVSLRYFNPVGAHDTALIGELPAGVPNNLVPFITQTAIGKRSALTVFGNDYPTPDGTCIRDYIHVVDLALAHVKALEFIVQQRNSAPWTAFNIGTGKGSSVLEVIASFEKVTGIRLNYRVGPRRSGDVTQIYASCEKARNVLGWAAERNLDDCMASAWKWEQKLAAQDKIVTKT